jgi:hypothetical protein
MAANAKGMATLPRRWAQKLRTDGSSRERTDLIGFTPNQKLRYRFNKRYRLATSNIVDTVNSKGRSAIAFGRGHLVRRVTSPSSVKTP